jgi:hypothetical protein
MKKKHDREGIGLSSSRDSDGSSRGHLIPDALLAMETTELEHHSQPQAFSGISRAMLLWWSMVRSPPIASAGRYWPSGEG